MLFFTFERKTNSLINFEADLGEEKATLLFSAGPLYSLYCNGKLISYGPNRTASGYARPRFIPLPHGKKHLLVRVRDYGIPNFEVDDEPPYFGAEIRFEDGTCLDSSVFQAYEEPSFLHESTCYSFQRGFVERYDFSQSDKKEVDLTKIDGPKLISEGVGDTCLYRSIPLSLVAKGPFSGFAEARVPNYAAVRLGYKPPFDVKKDFLEKVKEGYEAEEYALSGVETGLLGFDGQGKEGEEAFAVFDEAKPGGKWIYGRSGCNDLVCLKFGIKPMHVVTASPYCFKHILVIHRPGTKIVPHFIAIQNDLLPEIKAEGNKEIEAILAAAKNTYAQNAVDLFTDCPGRERAGWLCDSYFTALTEVALTGNDDMERDFLENFLLAEPEELPKGMVPMCFPSTHKDHNYIPNWAMWFVLEICRFAKRHPEFQEKAKHKVKGLLEFFSNYENEEGLLEDLPAWVFVEWSEAGSPDFVKGVSFPSNMEYAKVLEEASWLLHDPILLEKARRIREGVQRLSFHDGFYVDNALREDGTLKPCLNHVSETCQYYAWFFGFGDEEFHRKMAREYGPLGASATKPLAPSAPFIGFFLRLSCLASSPYAAQVKEEIEAYFLKMAESTHTLWEKDAPTASCNHGFASAVIPILFQALEVSGSGEVRREKDGMIQVALKSNRP